jgi:carbamate kinase
MESLALCLLYIIAVLLARLPHEITVRETCMSVQFFVANNTLFFLMTFRIQEQITRITMTYYLFRHRIHTNHNLAGIFTMNEKTRKPLVVVAVGGNAILRVNQKGTITEQAANVDECADQLIRVFDAGYQLLLTHGNGPQVGLIMLRDAYPGAKIPPMPLYIYTAESQGQIGFQLMNSLSNRLAAKGIHDAVAAVLTRVVVDAADPGFKTPTKPVGPFYSVEEITALASAMGFSYVEDSGRGYRKVVASPQPKEIVELQLIRDILGTGRSVIADGGGGIPVTKDATGKFAGVDAVVDKDLSSALLAEQVNADVLMLLTGVEQVAVNYNKPEMRLLGKISLAEAKRYHAEGHFPPGSMGPKMLAAINFVAKNGGKAIITTLEKGTEALASKAGTTILP